MEIKKAFEKVDSFSYPSSSRFITEDKALVSFTYTNSLLGQQEKSVSIISTHSPTTNEFFTRTYADSESLTAYSKDGEIKAVLRSLKYSPKMPVSTPKSTEETVSILEVSRGQRIIAKHLLNEETGNFTTHPTISSGLLFSPDHSKLAWIVSDKFKFEHQNESLGYTTKLSNFKDYGEDMEGIYHTSLVVFDLESQEAKVYGSPKGYGACQFSYASNNVIILQCVDLRSPRLLGLRSYTNRNFEIYGVKLNEETPHFVQLLGPKRLDPCVYCINDKEAILFTQKFPDHFGGHNGPLHPEYCKIDLDEMKVIELKTSPDSFCLDKNGNNIFINDHEVVLTENKQGLLTPVLLDLHTFEIKSLVSSEDRGVISYQVDDVCLSSGEVLVRKSCLNMLPQLCILNTKTHSITPLTEEYLFQELEVKIERCGCSNECSVPMLIAPSSSLFIVCPHGGPHGMSGTNFNRTMLVWSLCGYSIAQVNYTGSLGVPIDETRKIFGSAGTVDTNDVVSCVEMVKSKYSAKQVFIWGWSHGGFLSAHMAGKHSDLIDACVIGAPVINLVSSYYTTDIPDWALVESGISEECDGECDMTPANLEKMWNCSPIKYAAGISVPVLICHGSKDRRVPIGQSIELYEFLKKEGKPVKFIEYSGNGHSMNLRDSWDDIMVNTIKFFTDPTTFIEQEQ